MFWIRLKILAAQDPCTATTFTYNSMVLLFVNHITTFNFPRLVAESIIRFSIAAGFALNIK
jgi:hypothetical protein